jgi:SWI/SNF-related matrix-associated actin-dependent regulator of chromatin subfamily A member 5
LNGVGKTVTAIARDFQLRIDHPEHKNGPTLIVTEKIGLDVQLYHLKAMGVDEKDILVIDPKNRAPFEEALDQLREVLFRRKSVSDMEYLYYVMHYDAIRFISDHLLATPHPIVWFHVIADEFQLIKNPKAIRTKSFKRIRTRYKTGCTGNPADDKPHDIWSLLNWLYPKDYPSYWKFYNKYMEFEEKFRHNWYVDPATGVRRFKKTGYRELTGVKNIGRLHKEIEPFYIRRLLTDVVRDMPDKIQVQPPITVKMTAAQRKMYDQMKKKSMTRIGDMDSGQFVLMAPSVVAVVQRLQQIALGTITPIWEAEEGVPDDDVDWEHPRISIGRPSPKLDALMELITNHEEESFIVFTWFRGMADLVEDECQRKGISVVKIHGGTTSNRSKLVEEFQCGKARIFVGTIASAGKVITLDRAHHVIFTDRSWNPNLNAQAEDRAWRRMQRNAVRIYTIEMADSIDQARAEKIKSKADMVDAIANPKRYA